MTTPSMKERKLCWKSRDEYWQCLDSNDENQTLCKKWRIIFEENCSAVWVKHFDRKREYDKFKKEMDENNWEFPIENTEQK